MSDAPLPTLLITDDDEPLPRPKKKRRRKKQKAIDAEPGTS